MQAAVLDVHRVQDVVYRNRCDVQRLELLEHGAQLSCSRREVDVQSDVFPMRVELHDFLQLAIGGHRINLYRVTSIDLSRRLVGGSDLAGQLRYDLAAGLVGGDRSARVSVQVRRFHLE